MTRLAVVVLPLLLAIVGPAAADGGEERPPIRHEWRVTLDPTNGGVAVEGRLTLPPSPAGKTSPSEFVLNAAFTLEPTAGVETVPGEEPARGLRLNGSELARDSAASVRRYRLLQVPEDGIVELRYSGAVAFGLSDQKEEYTRGFRETVGHVGADGVYLAGDSFWYPYFDDGLVSYGVVVDQPEGWHVISAGRGTSRGDDGAARWESEGPVDEIYLTGGPLEVWRAAAGAVDTLVYLREDDPALATKYLTTTAQYLEMYRELIGPYPYSKFALVENFWETGYGMPSFTLLGPRVIRFPFILHSSYPHEILHNWWGNGVFVDYESGNWCEGLTAYLADHLVQEQRGRGDAYRRDTLQKYRNYVDDGRDFPLEEFRARHSAATEAVGYGKSLMGFHMLRRAVGDDTFRASLSDFWRKYRGRRASFDDIRGVLESRSGIDFGPFFEQWLQRTGAPVLTVRAERVGSSEDGYRVRGTLEQVQPDAPFRVDVPVVVDTPSGSVMHHVRTEGRETPFELVVEDEPSRLRVDPQFDVFRILDAREMPPSIGQLFGEPRILAVLPADASEELRRSYRSLVEGWNSESHVVDVVLDAELDRLPDERAVWIVGLRNRYADELFGGGRVAGFSMTSEEAELAGQRLPLAGRSWVVVRRHPADDERAVGLLVVDPASAFDGIGRKLPHYGKYSYLAFEGEAPDNVVKGQWPTDDSPLVVDLRPTDDRAVPLPEPPPSSREPLAELPPVFSERALAEHVAFLASPELEGRGLGSAGLERAARYVADRFRELGLEPIGEDGSFLQRFRTGTGPDGTPQEVANVIGYLPGANDAWDGQSVVVSAHYDHLGRGWPDVHAGDEGQIHPGADDNASGVAVLLELAASYAAGDAPDRTLVFAAFTAEEAGRLGSRHFVEDPGPFPVDGIRAVVNLDTVGRLGDGAISVLATGTADEWPHIFRGVGFVTGIDSRNVSEPLDASDQTSFIEAGIPAVQLFTGAHGDYHRPGDTPEKVDAAGLVRVATFVKETLDYLVTREEPLSVTIEGVDRTHAPRSGAGRRVSFGIVPDFAFPGPGVQVDSLVPGSPAEQAGILAGDVLLRIDDTELADLRAFSDKLKALQPGQTVEATVQRNGKQTTVPVTVTER